MIVSQKKRVLSSAATKTQIASKSILKQLIQSMVANAKLDFIPTRIHCKAVMNVLMTLTVLMDKAVKVMPVSLLAVKIQIVQIPRAVRMVDARTFHVT